MGYKHLFGENYGASAAGVYAAVRCLHSGRFASLHAGEMALPEIRSVAVVNHDGRSVSVSKEWEAYVETSVKLPVAVCGGDLGADIA